MAGRSYASNLTGLLNSMAGTIGSMGEGGSKYVDTFRRSTAPDVDMSDSASLLGYADWARRNGYDEEARQYLGLGYKQKAIEAEKDYKTGTAQDTEKLRGYNTSMRLLNDTIAGYESTDVRDSDVGPVANPKLESAKQALNRLAGERQLLIDSMNKRGNASDFGIGNEGYEAERQIIKEDLAAEKAAIETERSFNELMLQRQELADLASSGEKIPDYLLPDNLHKAYDSAYTAAKNHPTNPQGEMRKVNKLFQARGEKYLEELGQGDPAAITAVAVAEKDLRDVGGDVGEWLVDPQNEPMLKYVREETIRSLTSNPDYRSADEKGKKTIASDTFRKVLRAYSVDLDLRVEELREDMIADSASASRSAQVTTEDYLRGYPVGWQPGGPNYRRLEAEERKAEGDAFDSAAFAEAWNLQYYRPDGMRPGTNSSPTSRVMSKGPY